MNFNTMISRSMRAVRLDLALYNEVEADTSLNGEALAVVLITTVLSFVGTLLGGVFSTAIGTAAGLSVPFGTVLLGAAASAVWAIVGYYIWSYLTWFIGTRIFGGQAEPGELMRAIGYSYAPRALGIFGFIPCVGGIAGFIGWLWSLVCGIIAIREALDFTTGKAVVTAVIGWLVIIIIDIIISGIFGIGMWGLSSVIS